MHNMQVSGTSLNRKSVNFNSAGNTNSQPKLNLQSMIDEDEQVPGQSSITGVLNRIKYSKYNSLSGSDSGLLLTNFLFHLDAEVVLSLSSRELRDLFLPFHLVGVDETNLPVAEALDILQLDLEASLTPIEQRVSFSLLLLYQDIIYYCCALSVCSFFVRNSA
jgi:hypothetical protein